MSMYKAIISNRAQEGTYFLKITIHTYDTYVWIPPTSKIQGVFAKYILAR